MDNEDNLANIKRYNPQHPLPEEIREMGRNDTVCQFCGVSYLIHNEIKSLQEELDEYKSEVERLRHCDEQEKILKEQVDTLNITSKELLEKWQVEEKRNNEYEELILQKNVYISQLKNNIETFTRDLESKEARNEDLRKQVTEVTGVAVKIRISTKELHDELLRTYKLYKNLICQFMDHWKKQKNLILDRVAQLINMFNNTEVQNKQLKYDIDCQSSKIRDADMKYENQKNLLEQCSESVQKYKNCIGLCIVQFSEMEKKQIRISEKYSKQIGELNMKVHKLGTYLKSVKNQERFINSVEKYKHENIQLKDELARMINAHQHQIKQLHDSFREKLLQADEHSGKLDEKLKGLQCRFDEEKRHTLAEYSESLNEATTESEAKYNLLHISKEKCQREVKKLEDKLKVQQRKFTEEKSQLLKEVTESYEKAAADTEARYKQLNEEKVNHVKTIRKLEQCLESMQVKFHGEMLKQVEQHEKEKKNMENRIAELSKQLLEETQNSKGSVSNEVRESRGRKIEDLQSALVNAKEIIIEKSCCIEEYKSEISSLRDCVRRECEERFELTEALAEARTELLSQQRFSNKNSSPKQFLSQPRVNQKISSPNKLSEIHISHDKLVKLEELSNPPGSLGEPKRSHGNLKTSSSKSGSISKSRSSGNSLISLYPKNKLKISLKNK